MASKRTILITGCSDGSLGSALALAFHKAEWRVFASARNISKLKEVAAAGIETVQLDVCSAESIATGVSKIEELTGGSLDALLNNAGAGYCSPLMDDEISRVRELFELNVFPILGMTRAFLPLLRRSTYGGMVVNNTSAAALLSGALPLQGAYGASKAAAASLTEILRIELVPFGIKVINMLTGSVQSTFFQHGPPVTLPPDSLYNVAKEAVEKHMSGDENKNGSDRVQWAEQVVKDLSKPNPPHWVSRGRFASQARLADLLPIGLLDGVRKSMTGLDVLEKNIKEQGGADKIKQI